MRIVPLPRTHTIVAPVAAAAWLSAACGALLLAAHPASAQVSARQMEQLQQQIQTMEGKYQQQIKALEQQHQQQMEAVQQQLQTLQNQMHDTQAQQQQQQQQQQMRQVQAAP